MKTGTLIKELRIKKGLTQEELAMMTELSARTIQRIENGEVDPRSYTLQMIARALEVDFSLFVEDDSSHLNDNDNLTCAMLHLSALLPIFLPSILVWLCIRKKVRGMKDHYNYVISFQLTIWLMFVIPGIIIHYFLGINYFISIAPVLVLLGAGMSILFSIVNTINVINNKPYKRFTLINQKNNK